MAKHLKKSCRRNYFRATKNPAHETTAYKEPDPTRIDAAGYSLIEEILMSGITGLSLYLGEPEDIKKMRIDVSLKEEVGKRTIQIAGKGGSYPQEIEDKKETGRLLYLLDKVIRQYRKWGYNIWRG